ncbi:unnamed protein product [Soboliphyme baturini]|uniref:Uncharacterized protein n=1 Tax=Soboliphyme baturini TaxID=241478 RepID=A0A3P8D7V9_9BILA|nr:unnamed protein product [Soboliphyme baturini]
MPYQKRFLDRFIFDFVVFCCLCYVFCYWSFCRFRFITAWHISVLGDDAAIKILQEGIISELSRSPEAIKVKEKSNNENKDNVFAYDSYVAMGDSDYKNNELVHDDFEIAMKEEPVARAPPPLATRIFPVQAAGQESEQQRQVVKQRVALSASQIVQSRPRAVSSSNRPFTLLSSSSPLSSLSSSRLHSNSSSASVIAKREGEEEFPTFVRPAVLPQLRQRTSISAAAGSVAVDAPSATADSSNAWSKMSSEDLGNTIFIADYPEYGVTGPVKQRYSPELAAMDAKLASSAQLYHYQHTKLQIIAMEQGLKVRINDTLTNVERLLLDQTMGQKSKKLVSMDRYFLKCEEYQVNHLRALQAVGKDSDTDQLSVAEILLFMFKQPCMLLMPGRKRWENKGVF